MACRRYEGRVCVVTASTQGIGLAIAARFAQEGGRVVISSRKQAGVDEALAVIRKLNGVDAKHVAGITCHVDNKEQRAKLLQFAKATYGAIDVLVLNAAVSAFAGPTMETPEKAYDKLFATNVKSTFLFAQEALPFMAPGDFPTKPGKFTPTILLVGSIGGYLPSSPIGIYGVTKTAMIGLMKSMHHDLAKKGVRVNLLAPGLIRTRFASVLVDAAEGRTIVDNVEKAEDRPLGRIGEPMEMAGVAAFLCSADASYVAGECVVAAGFSPRL